MIEKMVTFYEFSELSGEIRLKIIGENRENKEKFIEKESRSIIDSNIKKVKFYFPEIELEWSDYRLHPIYVLYNGKFNWCDWIADFCPFITFDYTNENPFFNMFYDGYGISVKFSFKNEVLEQYENEIENIFKNWFDSFIRNIENEIDDLKYKMNKEEGINKFFSGKYFTIDGKEITNAIN